MSDCGALTCPDPRGRAIKRAGHTAAAGQASRWLIEQARAFRREIEEMKKTERGRDNGWRNGEIDIRSAAFYEKL